MDSPSRIKTSYMAHRDGEEPADDDPLLGFAPVPRKIARRGGLTPARQKKFIAALAAGGVVTDAARAAGASMEGFYQLRNAPGAEQFRAAWDMALDRAMARVEGAAVQRAVNGEDRMVVSAGQLMGFERRHNEALVMFLLRNRRADRYGQEWSALKPGHPVYERIRREAIAELRSQEPDIEEVRAEILGKLAAIDRAAARSASEAGGGAGADEADPPEDRKALPAPGPGRPDWPPPADR